MCRNRRKDHFIDVHVGTGCVSRVGKKHTFNRDKNEQKEQLCTKSIESNWIRMKKRHKLKKGRVRLE